MFRHYAYADFRPLLFIDMLPFLMRYAAVVDAAATLLIMLAFAFRFRFFMIRQYIIRRCRYARAAMFCRRHYAMLMPRFAMPSFSFAVFR